jgi:hypothetical protein
MKTQLDLAIEIAENFQRISDKYDDIGNKIAFDMIISLLCEYRDIESLKTMGVRNELNNKH